MTDPATLLAENRQLRIEIDSLRAELFAARGEQIRHAQNKRLPLRLTVPEFAKIVRLCDETIRRQIRSRQIEASGQPFLIPRRELEKFGVSLADAEELFSREAA